jgi:hypothetical protein
MPLVYRLVKGSPLTKEEHDGNLDHFQDQITDIVDNPPEARGVADITVTDGNQVTFIMTDATEEGPFAITVTALNPRGEWAPATPYLANDLFLAPDGQSYVVTTPHTSAASFDPNANGGGPPNYYQLLVQTPAAAVPSGGEAGMVLTKATDTSYDLIWAAVPGPVVYEVTGTTFAATPLLTNRYFRCTNDDGCLVSLPQGDDDDDVPLGAEYHFRACTSGQVILDTSTDTDVVLNLPEFFMAATMDRGSIMVAKKVGPEEYDVFGRLAPYDSDTL